MSIEAMHAEEYVDRLAGDLRAAREQAGFIACEMARLEALHRGLVADQIRITGELNQGIDGAVDEYYRGSDEERAAAKLRWKESILRRLQQTNEAQPDALREISAGQGLRVVA